jgi:hypothetical protein
MNPPSLQSLAAGVAARVHPNDDLSGSTVMVYNIIMQKKASQLLDFIQEQGGLVELRSKLWNGNLFQRILLYIVREMEECSLDSTKKETSERFFQMFKSFREHLAKSSYDFVTQSLACTPLMYQSLGGNLATETRFFQQKNEKHTPFTCADRPVAHAELVPLLEANKKENLNIHKVFVNKFARKIETCQIDDSETWPWSIVNIEKFFFGKLFDMVYEQKKRAHHKTIAYGFDLLLCNKPISNKEKRDQLAYEVLESEVYFSLKKKQKLEKIQTRSQKKELEQTQPKEAAELLSFQRHRIKFRDHSLFKSYYTYLWGMLAISMASVGIEPKFAVACLKQAEKLVTCFSQEIDVLLYKQKVFAKFGWLTNETQVFQELFKILPRNSNFFMKMLKVHFYASIASIENCIFHTLMIENVITDEDFFIPLEPIVAQFADQKTKNLKTAKDILFELKRLLLEILWKIQNVCEYKFHEVEEFMEIVNLYETILECKFHVRRSRKVYDVEAMAFKLKDLDHHISSFMRAFTEKGFYFQRYSHSFSSHLNRLKWKSATHKPIEKGNVMFSHVILMKCLKSNDTMYDTYSDERCRKANDIFENYNHHRKFMTSTFFETVPECIPKKPPPLQVYLAEFSDLDVESFLQDKKILHFIDSGIQS